MLLLPQIGWESQRDLTHSVLVTTLAAATLYVVVLLLRRPRPLLYLALGVVAGLGVLAKYSYVAFVLALGLALLTGRDTRAVLLNPWILAAGAVALAIVMPHALWLLDHWRQAAHGTVEKLGSQGAATRAGRGVLGLGSLLLAVLEFTGLWALVMLAVFGRSIWHRPAALQGAERDATLPDLGRLWARYAIVLGVFFVGMVLVGDVTKFKDRWMQPFLFMVPLIFFACSPQLARHPRLGWLRRILAGVAILLFVLITLRTPVAAWRGRFDELNYPMPELARTLRQHGYDGRGTIFTSERVLGGALRLQFPEAHVRVARDEPAPPDDRPLLVIDSTSGSHASTAALDAAQSIAAGTPIMDVALPYRYARPGSELARYRYRVVE
jgi:hypothetical protein